MDGIRLLGPRYTLNRELTDSEREYQLRQKEHLNLEMRNEASITRMNSTYLETVDRYFAWRGFVFSFLGFGFFLLLLFDVAATILCISRIHNGINPYGYTYTTTFFWLLSLPMILYGGWGTLQESFTYTYFPIRFNRKTRKVYVFRPGRPSLPILEADWDKIFFTRSPCNKGIHTTANWDIRGHILAKDGKTVLDTFALSPCISEIEDPDQKMLMGYWEVVRRYMEEGPKEVYDIITYCDPIYEHRETFKGAFVRLYRNTSSLGIVVCCMASLLWIPSFLGRCIAGLTCRTPRWPAHIEAVCPIEPNDPYIKDASMNAPKDQFY